jgi:hypothetical protein
VPIEVCLPDQLGPPAEHRSDGVRRVVRRERGLEKQVDGVPGLRRGRQPQVSHQMRPRGEPVPACDRQLSIGYGMPSSRDEALTTGMEVPDLGQRLPIPGPPRGQQRLGLLSEVGEIRAVRQRSNDRHDGLLSIAACARRPQAERRLER